MNAAEKQIHFLELNITTQNRDSMWQEKKGKKLASIKYCTYKKFQGLQVYKKTCKEKFITWATKSNRNLAKKIPLNIYSKQQT